MIFSKFIFLASSLMIIGLTHSSAARAGEALNLKLELESKLQEKVRSIVAPLDPYAQVVVNIQLRRITTELPGAAARVENFLSSADSTQLSSTDIELINLDVISKFNPMPEAVKIIIARAASLPQVRLDLTFHQTDKSVLAAIEARDATTRPLPFASEFDKLEKVGKEQLNAFYLTGAFFALVLLSAVILLRQGVKKDLAQIAAVISSASEKFSLEAPTGPIIDMTPVKNILNESSRNDDPERNFIQGMPTEGLVALISDCYWCEKDRYAAWIWSQMSSMQRKDVLQAWNRTEVYVGNFNGETEFNNYHNHPYYLRPLSTMEISQQDMLDWVRSHPSVWNFISPLRKVNLHLPLLEKINFLNLLAPAEIPPLPKLSSKSRPLTQSLDISEVTFADELAILKNPEKIPKNLQSKVLSIVWLALLPVSFQNEILEKMTASQLAPAWIGPDEILKSLESRINEKKLKLLLDYSQQVKPSRSSVSMQYIVQEALKKMNEIPTSFEEEGKRAA